MGRNYNQKGFSDCLRNNILSGMTNRQAVADARNQFNVPADDPAGRENVLRIRKELRREGLLPTQQDNTRKIRNSALGYRTGDLNFLIRFLERFENKTHSELLKIAADDLKTI